MANDAFLGRVKDILDLADRCFAAENSEGYETLGEELEELVTVSKDILRDHENCRSIVKKLESGESLTSDELNTVRMRIVGDADYYAKFDDDFDRNKTELKRIVDEIRSVSAGSLDLEGMMHLEVLCREASSVAKPAAFYLEEKARLRKFDDATRDGIDHETGKVLANILRGI